MIKVQLYKYRYTSLIPQRDGRDFNFFADGKYSALPPQRDGVTLVDCIEITDLLPGCISDAEYSYRDREDVRVYEISRYNVKLDLENGARSKILDHSIEEFFTIDLLKKKQVHCRMFYGNRKFEGFIDIPSIEWDFTWLDGKNDIEFSVDDTMLHFMQGMKKAAPMGKLPATAKMPYDEYFRDHHFVYFFNNASIAYFEDRLDLLTKLQPYWGPDATKPIISGFLQSKIIERDSSYSIYNATLSFSRGIGILFKISSVDDNGEFPIETRPFKLTYFFELDGITQETIENARVHRRGIKWFNKQHVIIPYWKLAEPARDGVSEYYMGLFMTAEAQTIVFGDALDGQDNNSILKWTSGSNLADRYEILQLNANVWVEDTYLFDLVYPSSNYYSRIEPNGNPKIDYAYCRILEKESCVFPFPQGTGGFADIIKVTAEKIYKYLCGEFKEKLILTIDFEPSSTMDVGSKVTFEEKEWRVERMYNFNLEKRNITIEMSEI